MVSESVYGRTWHAARQAALGPELAATALARRPYDLRHAALSRWLNATGARRGRRPRREQRPVLHDIYLHCIDSQQDHVSQRIEEALDADASHRPSSQWVNASGYTYRRLHPRRYMSVNRSLVPRITHARHDQQTRATRCRHPALIRVSAAQTASESISADIT
jgi:hypothetical protein